MRYNFKSVARDGAGNIVPSATVSVYLAGTTTAASVYAAYTGGTAVNSVTSGTDGVYEFYVDDTDYAVGQRFKIYISKTGYSSITHDYMTIFDINAAFVCNAVSITSSCTASSLGYSELNVLVDGLFTIATGQTFTIDVPFTAGLYQVFNCVGTGAVAGLKEANVLWFGAVGDGVTESRDAIQAAVNSLVEGGNLIIPPAVSYYKVTATQLSEAITISTAINVKLDGELRATAHTLQVNPPWIMNITADGTTVRGTGSFKGDGGFVLTNDGVNDNEPGLLLINADNVTVSGITFVDPQEIGILLKNANKALINNCTFTGGPDLADAVDTVYFYISMINGGNNITISNNRFTMDSAGGSARQAIYTGGSSRLYGLQITGNQFYNIHEHAIYSIMADNSLAANNTIIYTQDEDDQLGCAIAWGGSENVVDSNTITGALRGGIDARTSYRSIFSNNTLNNISYVGISINDNYKVTAGLNNNLIINNYLKASTTSANVYSGIRILNSKSSIDYVGNIIRGNTIVGFGGSVAHLLAIEIRSLSDGFYHKNYDISGNIITASTFNGIYLSGATNITIKNNLFYDNPATDFRPIYTGENVSNLTIESNTAIESTMHSFFYKSKDSCTDVWMLNNECYGASEANPFRHDAAINILGRGNRTNRDIPLLGTFTMNDVASLVVNNANIVQAIVTDAIATVVITPLGANSALVMGSAKALYVSAITAGTSFTVSTSDGNKVPATDHIFAYEIIQ
jgi:parallel beta-helix repeat protein